MTASWRIPGHERVTANGRVLLDVVDGVADVTEVDALVLHSGRNAARMRSRSAGLRLAPVNTSTLRVQELFEILAERHEVQ
jgi:hypothetical protein